MHLSILDTSILKDKDIVTLHKECNKIPPDVLIKYVCFGGLVTLGVITNHML